MLPLQHNCVSNGRSYTAKNFVPITHEFLMVIKKPDGYYICFQLPQKYQTDIRDSSTATWTDVVYSVVQAQESCSLTYIYEQIANNKKAKQNPHWKEKIRQVLGQHPSLFHQRERGVWAAKAAA